MLDVKLYRYVKGILICSMFLSLYYLWDGIMFNDDKEGPVCNVYFIEHITMR